MSKSSSPKAVKQHNSLPYGDEVSILSTIRGKFIIDCILHLLNGLLDTLIIIRINV